ncbi:MAG: PEGA domain-containing protein, partial [Gammaproteobacteria bacterium]|nr:PEGA domain-containing protein [Gammaproteobacteria bacterium]
RQVAIKVPGEKLTVEMIPQSTNFIVNSEPEGATVLIDGSSAGTTPMAAPVGVSSGLHTVVLQAPEGYFPWQQILDFGGSDINLTGKNTIKLAADFRNAIADQIKSKKIDDAISSLQQIAGDHPDYIAGQSMLAELYLDKKEDPSTAISHIEQALKAQQQNIQLGKKHSSIYVLLGKSYFSQASKLAEENIPAALLSHLKAIDALKKAQLSMRYFPKEKQKELTHDSFYYLALAYHNIYKLRPTELYLKNAQVAWQEFFDFYPKNLDKEDSYLEIKQKAEQLSSELTSLTTEPSHEQTGSDNPAPAQRDAPA